MNKADTILERLKSQPQPTIEQPDELVDNIMNSLPDREQTKAKPAFRWQLYASVIAVAASMLLLLIFQWKTDKTEEQPLVILQTPIPRQQPSTTTPEATARPILAQKKATKKRTRKSYTPPTDSIPITTQEPPSIVAQQVTIITPTPAEQIQREFREQTEFIRKRGEQVVYRVAAQQQAASNPQYIEL